MPTLDYELKEVYFRDTFLPFSQASLSIASSPILYGLSIYTVFGVNWDEKQTKLLIFRLAEHYNRLIRSARIMDFHSFVEEWPYEKFKDVMLELLTVNKINEDALVRVTVFIDGLIAGTRIHGLKNSLSAYVYPMGEILPLSGAHICVSSWTRNSDNAIPSRAKVNGSYVNASLMKNEALLNGYDDAISLDEHGHVAEGTVANLFIVREGKLITPATDTDILEGITRDSILKIVKDLGIDTEERVIDRSELYIADEAFFCGSSARVAPILSIDKRPLNGGSVGNITKMISDIYFQVQHGRKKQYSSWLTSV